ncbi:DUF1553 domain-containing protein [Armatimonas rosea]|uniref:Cell wall-associated NlpC family hydrolase n=1 Tax=Armatimonas rosea TaxID=685828 RepID=A0A7W9W3Z8_ARMRO|nr:DUF1553 domain-containing protein [Armatimonas rosea]MBB6048919.1 cell wall-associated NlpC family hydrolase [Armatimonas rosea]
MRWWMTLVALLAALPSQAQNAVLQRRCVSCHSGTKPAGGLDLSRVEAVKQNASRILRAAESGQMPPSGKLPVSELALLKKALPTTTTLWSLKPLTSPPAPSPKGKGVSIDALVRAELAKKGLKPSPEADKRTLIRRVTVDLTGLPPTAEEIAAFVKDMRPDAYEKLVDRLLASPAYGEKWARHWLDVVRFGESNGYERNLLRENAWPYRDWVIGALNADMPYERFVKAQLAGDQVGEAAATGFLVAGVHDDVPSPDEVLTRQQRASDLDDMVATTAETFLGLTVGCARCHDHKFDPIPQTDYYRLSAVFAGVYHGERELEPQGKVSALERQRRFQSALWEVRGLAKAEQKLSALGNEDAFPPTYAKFVRFTILSTQDGSEPCLDELAVYGPESSENLALNGKPTASSLLPGYKDHQLAHLTDGWLGNAYSWISNEPGKGWVQVELPHETTINLVTWGRDASGQFADRLAATYKIEVSEDGERWHTVATHESRGVEQPAAKEREALLKKVYELRDGKRAYLGKLVSPEPVYLLRRGDVMQRVEEVSPGAPLGDSAVSPFAKGEEPRLALASWLVRRDNPLTWRVIVNRIWQQHFGVGLVTTPSDFGNNGAKPSNQALLDSLAVWFRESGQSFKKLHKLIVTSATYKQSAVTPQPKAQALDGSNRLLWRGPLRRMESEALWDAVLATSGTLDRTLGGPPYRLFTYKQENIAFYGPATSYGSETWRRSVYRMAVRAVRDNLLACFDCPESAQRAPKREVTTTPLQALSLLNGPFIREQATHLAQRVQKEAGPQPERQISRAFQLAFGRTPRPDELALARPLVAKDGLPALCRALFNAHEFLYY